MRWGRYWFQLIGGATLVLVLAPSAAFGLPSAQVVVEAPPSRFAWFSVEGVDERLDSEASDRGSLGGYLQARSDRGERLRLVAMDTEYERARNITHIAYNVERSERETLGSATVVVGKGAVDCESEKIMVWSMGTSEGGLQVLCGSVPGSVDRALPIVCVRESF